MKSGDENTEPGRQIAGQFATTHWSLVLAAAGGANADAHASLEKLCRAYWPPLYAYASRRVSGIHEAQDLTQAFFERLLEKKYLSDADPQRGRFRAYLITAFKHFLSNEWTKAKAKKRGGGRTLFSFDFAAHDSADAFEPSTVQTADQIYERKWAITLLNRVMDNLQREMRRTGRDQQFRRLKDFIVSQHDQAYAAVAMDLGLSEPAARMAASRLRRRYRELLREEISQTVCSAEEIDDEIHQLFAILAR